MDWLPNNDAVIYFINEVLPLIWKKKDDVRFTIVGKGPSRQMLDAAEKDPRIIVTDRVDDVRPFIDRSRIFVVPIRVGGGTRLKILEAMSMEKAVISTSVGAEGIRHSDGENIVIQDEPQGFADAVLSLIGDHDRELRMGKAGRKLVRSVYDWEIVGNTLNAKYQEVLREGRS